MHASLHQQPDYKRRADAASQKERMKKENGVLVDQGP